MVDSRAWEHDLVEIESGAARETPVMARIRRAGDGSWTSKSLFQMVAEPSAGQLWLDLLADRDVGGPVLSIPLPSVPDLPAGANRRRRHAPG